MTMYYLVIAAGFLALISYLTSKLLGCIFWIAITILLLVGAAILT